MLRRIFCVQSRNNKAGITLATINRSGPGSDERGVNGTPTEGLLAVKARYLIYVNTVDKSLLDT